MNGQSNFQDTFGVCKWYTLADEWQYIVDLFLDYRMSSRGAVEPILVESYSPDLNVQVNSAEQGVPQAFNYSEVSIFIVY